MLLNDALFSCLPVGARVGEGQQNTHTHTHEQKVLLVNSTFLSGFVLAAVFLLVQIEIIVSS